MTKRDEAGRRVVARYGAEHKERTRRRIVETAGRRLKTDGMAGSGVAALMADAGLTNGAFYGHFASKDDLVAGVVTDQLATQRDRIDGAIAGSDTGVEDVVRAYLSPAHRDGPADGCVSAALLGEIAHSGDAVRRAYSAGLLDVVDAVAVQLDPRDPGPARVAVLAAFAGMFGTLQTARAITDPALSDALLERGVDVALAQLGLRPATAGRETTTEVGTA